MPTSLPYGQVWTNSIDPEEATKETSRKEVRTINHDQRSFQAESSGGEDGLLLEPDGESGRRLMRSAEQDGSLGGFHIPPASALTLHLSRSHMGCAVKLVHWPFQWCGLNRHDGHYLLPDLLIAASQPH